MARKAIMVDVDGVLITHPDVAGWTANLDRDLGISAAALQSVFFRPHWSDVVHGRAALRERLAPALDELTPSVSCDCLIDYWFDNDAFIDTRLLDELATLRSAGLEVHIASNQEHERAQYLWNRLDLRSKFDGIHYSAALGFSKPAAQFYRSVEEAIVLGAESIFFVDDNASNVTAARNCGWTAALWTGRESLADLMLQQKWNVH